MPFGDHPCLPATADQPDNRPLFAVAAVARWGLLAVVLQYQIARLADLGAILLQAGQNGEIALIDNLAAIAFDIARTGRLFLRGAAALLGHSNASRGNDRKQGESEKKLLHCVPYTVTAENRQPGQHIN
jgi:hypothetical protein